MTTSLFCSTSPFSQLGSFFPGHYRRDQKWSSTPTALVPPMHMEIDVGGKALRLSKYPALDINDHRSWDAQEWADPSARAGKDFYVYACTEGAPFVLSRNSTCPSGAQYTADNTRKIGGFHCLCADVGEIEGHALSGLLAGQILPTSVWDMLHRPLASPEGMAYSANTGKWYQIYLTDVNGDSIFGGSIATNNSPLDLRGYDTGNWFWFNELFAARKMRFLTNDEFQIVAGNSNSETNIENSSFPSGTGGHVDTNGRRMISDIGLEDCCGVVNIWLAEQSGIYDAAVTDGTNFIYPGHGSMRGTCRVITAGGNYAHSTQAGPSFRDCSCLIMHNPGYYGSRGVSEPLTSI